MEAVSVSLEELALESTLESTPELMLALEEDLEPISVSMYRTISRLVSMAESILAAMEGPVLMIMSSILMTPD